jgi:hypothetical protein
MSTQMTGRVSRKWLEDIAAIIYTDSVDVYSKYTRILAKFETRKEFKLKAAKTAMSSTQTKRNPLLPPIPTFAPRGARRSSRSQFRANNAV